MVSRAAAIILFLMYCLLLVFVLWTHKDIMDTEHADSGNMEMSPNPAHLQQESVALSGGDNQTSEEPTKEAAEFVVDHGGHGHMAGGAAEEEDDDEDEAAEFVVDHGGHGHGH